MSQKTVQLFIGQLLTDEELRFRFVRRPLETLVGLRDRLIRNRTQLSNAIDALGVTPATTVKVNVTPALVPIGTAGWQFTSGGFALKPAGVTGAHGMTSVVLPDNAVIQSLRGTGRTFPGERAGYGKARRRTPVPDPCA